MIFFILTLNLISHISAARNKGIPSKKTLQKTFLTGQTLAQSAMKNPVFSRIFSGVNSRNSNMENQSAGTSKLEKATQTYEANSSSVTEIDQKKEPITNHEEIEKERIKSILYEIFYEFISKKLPKTKEKSESNPIHKLSNSIENNDKITEVSDIDRSLKHILGFFPSKNISLSDVSVSGEPLKPLDISSEEVIKFSINFNFTNKSDTKNKETSEPLVLPNSLISF